MVEIAPMMKRIAKWTALVVLIGTLLGAAALAGVFYYFGRDLPNVISREDFDPSQISRVYSADGHVIGEYYTPGAKRTVVSMEKIPEHVKHAFMAAEDADFYSHEGIDYLGLVRAFYYAIVHDTGLKGTSTITQQVIKNLVLTPEKKIERKIKEFILARKLEQNLTKDDILFLYLNTIYLGHGVNGVEEASRLYFGKSVADISLVEAAILAGLTQSPERHSPLKNPDRIKKRRAFVLEQLCQKGFIDEATYRQAGTEKIVLAKRSDIDPHLWIAPHFTEYLRLKLIDEMGEEKVLGGGLRIQTTIRVSEQLAAKKAVTEELQIFDARQGWYAPVKLLKADAIKAHHKREKKKFKDGFEAEGVYVAVVTKVGKGELNVRLGDIDGTLSLDHPRVPKDPKKLEKRQFKVGHTVRVAAPKNPDAENVRFEFAPGPEAALVSIDPATREVTAVVGGYDFNQNQFNHALNAKLPTGSTFKPFVYAAAMEAKQITPATTFLDSPYVLKMDGEPDWAPKNSDGTWRGEIRVREALGASRNVVAARIMSNLGVKAAHAFARKAGLSSKLVDNFTLVLGSSELLPIEITNAYATFAAKGRFAEPIMVTRIESTVDGTVKDFHTTFEQRIDPKVAYLTTFLLTASVHGYTDRTGKRRGGTAYQVAKLGHKTAGKTGTTNEAQDAWFIGYTAKKVTGVWVGFSGKKRPLGSREGGGKTAAPIWLNFMKSALKDQKPIPFEVPEGLVEVRIDPVTGLLANEGGILETFIEGTQPTEYAPTAEEKQSDDFLLNQLGVGDGPPEEAPTNP